MKDKRNCNNASYPMYGEPMMMPYPMQMPINNQIPMQYNNYDKLNSIEQQINLLEQRVTRLEKAGMNSNNTTYNKYNDSNYYMV